MADGSLIGGTAALEEAYASDPESRNVGMLAMDEQTLHALVRAGHQLGWQLAIHAIGDRAVRLSLEAIEAALHDGPTRAHRHRIEHCGVLSRRLIERIQDLGVVACTQPAFVWEFGDGFVASLGPGRSALTYPLKSLVDAGIVLAAGSDRPGANGNPLLAIHCAVNRTTETGQAYAADEKISPEAAIRLYTWNGAYASFEEDLKGSIEPGKLADLVVLSEDPTKADPGAIKDIVVTATIVGGEAVYERGS
jgi:predicted amidohydrolase YtcJ